jgi:hypothetical protein
LPENVRQYDGFLVGASNKDVVDAINRIADEGMAYLPDRLLYFRNFIVIDKIAAFLMPYL